MVTDPPETTSPPASTPPSTTPPDATATPPDKVDADEDGFYAGDGVGDDCDDTDPNINPDVESDDCDTKDNDCDGEIDENPGELGTIFYADRDSDGFGDGGTTQVACELCPGCAAEGTDCDDDDEDVNPGETELCNGEDEDCDTKVDEGFDEDGDGHQVEGACATGDDCDDNDADVYGGENPAPLLCDGKDNDCDGDGDVDEGFDSDGDGHFIDDEVSNCRDHYSEGELDCDDIEATVYYGAPELCDELDNNCDTVVDESEDADGDGVVACDEGRVVDCDDEDATVYPDAPELCDAQGNDCIGPDQAPTPQDEIDTDGDGYMACEGCVEPLLCGDAIEGDATTYPGADEVCGNFLCIDNDQDGLIDEGCPDDDGNGVANGCDDPCDGEDNDGDGNVDENSDQDGDGYYTCLRADLERGPDCDDSDASVNACWGPSSTGAYWNWNTWGP